MDGIDNAKTISELKDKLYYFQQKINKIKKEKIQTKLDFKLNDKLFKTDFNIGDYSKSLSKLPDVDLSKIQEKSHYADSKSSENNNEKIEDENTEKETPEEQESNNISVGLTVGSNILQDGSNNIYSEKSKVVKKSKINVKELARNDIKGAITGAVSLGAASIFAPPAAPAAVVAGSIGGAIVGSIDATFDQLWDKLFHRSDN